jgi:N-acetylmuramoyl-L-alanine amidase
MKNRKAQCGYYKVSRFCEFPSILFETAFISNPEEYEWFTSTANMDIAATGITAGIVDFFTKQS